MSEAFALFVQFAAPVGAAIMFWCWNSLTKVITYDLRYVSMAGHGGGWYFHSVILELKNRSMIALKDVDVSVTPIGSFIGHRSCLSKSIPDSDISAVAIDEEEVRLKFKTFPAAESVRILIMSDGKTLIKRFAAKSASSEYKFRNADEWERRVVIIKLVIAALFGIAAGSILGKIYA